MAYAIPADMIVRYDANRLGQLVADNGVQVSAPDLAANPVLQTMLEDASAMITSALITGGRYTVEELTDFFLTGEENAYLLRRITCDLAYGLLLQRRGYPLDQIRSIAPGVVTAYEWLERLRSGQAVFPLPAHVEAGRAVPEVVLARQEPLMSTELPRLFGDLVLRRDDNRLSRRR